jgi:hypothetical protein
MFQKIQCAVLLSENSPLCFCARAHEEHPEKPCAFGRAPFKDIQISYLSGTSKMLESYEYLPKTKKTKRYKKIRFKKSWILDRKDHAISKEARMLIEPKSSPYKMRGAFTFFSLLSKSADDFLF